MLNIRDFRNYVVRPTLERIGLHSPTAERLVLGTALVESNLHALDQSSDETLGPAYGLFQMEPRTHDDIWKNFLAHRQPLKVAVMELRAAEPSPHFQLVTNMAYATAMCRVHYLRDPRAIPESTEEQAAYWKRVYNTRLGKGEPIDFTRAWRLAGLPLVT